MIISMIIINSDDNEAIQDVATRPPKLDEATRPPMQDEASNAGRGHPE